MYREPQFHYSELPYTVFAKQNKHIMLNGYFQSYKYFDENKEQICKLLNIQKYKNQINSRFEENYFQNVISLHFRLGDYIYLQQNIQY